MTPSVLREAADRRAQTRRCPVPSGSPIDFRRWSAIACGLGAVLVLAACGGASESGSSGGPGEPASTPTTFEVFLASIDVIDPAAPAAIYTVDANAEPVDADQNPVGAVSIVSGTASSGKITNAEVKWVLYPRSDGTLWRISTDLLSGTPTPIRVSNETDALPFCAVRIGLDVVTPDATGVFYGVGNPTCDDPLDWRFVSLADGASVAPRSYVGIPMANLWHPTLGSHRGWLALDGNELRVLSPELQVLTVLQGGVTDAEILGANADGTIFVELDQNLYAYKPLTHNLTTLHYRFKRPCPCGGAFATRDTSQFLFDAGKLYRVDVGSRSVVPIDFPTDAVTTVDSPNHFVAIGKTRVAWGYTNDPDRNLQTTSDRKLVLRSIGRDGSGALKLDEFAPAELPAALATTFVPTASDDWVFYNRVSVGQNSPTAAAATLDGSQVRISIGGLWVGRSASTILGLGEPGLSTRMLRVSGIQDLTNLANNNPLGLATTLANDPMGLQAQLGTLPAGARFASAEPGLGSARVGTVLIPDGFGGLQSDLLYWDDATDASLRRVTTTNDESELAADLF